MMFTENAMQATAMPAAGPAVTTGYGFSIFPLIILTIIVCIVLQVILSKKENKFLGLIIPILHFLAIILFVAYLLATSGGYANNLLFFPIFPTALVPEAIYLIIYFVSRGKIDARNKSNREMQKMNAQDLH